MEYVVRSVVALMDLFFKAPASYIRIKLKKKKKTEEKKNQFNQQLEEGKTEGGHDDDLT